MKVFLSWSGDLSHEFAEILCDWLPVVLQNVKPFFTPDDIEKGARWEKDISQELEASSFGLFCLTKENLSKPWIMFEAGALSKSVATSRVCPILFGVEPTDLVGPLVHFQAVPFSEHEMLKLVRGMNKGLGDQQLDELVLSRVFKKWWPDLDEKVTKTMEQYADKSDRGSARDERELLEEILQLARLSATYMDSSLRNPGRIDPSTLSHALSELLWACNQRAVKEDLDLLRILREVFKAIRDIAEQSSFSGTFENELNNGNL